MKKFLIVDDDSDDRDLFCEALSEINKDFDCDISVNGRKALKALENKEIDIPDIIFLDINMPIMNGWQLLIKLKELEAYKSIPIIIYSTSSYPEDVTKAQQLGAQFFFTKPSDFRELKQILNVIIKHLNEGTLAFLNNYSSILVSVSK